MRNLRNLRHSGIEFSDDASISATAWDGTSLLVAFGPTQQSPAITIKRLAQDAWNPEQATSVASWDAPSPTPDLEVDRILSLRVLADSGSICLVLEGGDIVIVREDPQPGEEMIEIVGSVDAGIAAAAWSPDEELLIIATKAETLLFMTRDFEGTATVTLSSEDVKVSSHVSVGWGKKETQFKGRGAKALRDPTVPEHIDEGKLSSFDDLQTTISWRGDGQFVAVNSLLGGEPKRRIIRVYSREGILESVSEPVDGLEAALSWKPSGQMIAGVQRFDERADVVFFERNGLRHGEFGLRLTADELATCASDIDLSWNNDSSVLAVAMKDRVQLWTMGNYHYYLKQEIRITNSDNGALRTNWHSERPLQLSCSSTRSLRQLDYTFEVSRGSVNTPDDHGVVAVIDGKTLKITPLRTANVPPPMAFDEVELKHSAIDVAVSRDGTQIAVLHDSCISVWKCNYGSKPASRATHEIDLTLGSDESLKDWLPRQILFDMNGDPRVLLSQVNGDVTRLLRRENGSASSETLLLNVSSIAISRTPHKIIYIDGKGAVSQLDGDSVHASAGKLPAACTSIDAWQEDDINILFGLTRSGILYVQSAQQSLKISSCTSFIVTATHLIYTTSSHLLKFIHLHIGELDIPPDEPEKDERCRNIERGAKLVTVMPSAYSLVLQMPRGNLETIYPRALVLAGIRGAIGQRDYKKAFRICRTQRVDMNILHDYAPAQFMQDVSLVVKQLKKPEYIDLVLSSLSEEDVSQTIYQDTIKAKGEPTNGVTNGDVPHLTAPSSSKVNQICDAFLHTLAGQEATYLQSIVTAHVCKNPPDLIAGLYLISDLRKRKEQDQLEQAIDHICFLADVNRLYDTALGLYDLDVALLVAQQSQKDPREYLPYLQKLHDMQPLRQRFSIDNDLKRHSKALTHLHAMNEFDELKSYTTKHDLYSAAVELYRYDNTRLAELMRLHADFLTSRNRYKEAGIAYEFINDHTSAHEAYRAAGMWRECLASAMLASVSDEALDTLARDLADSLEESKDFVSAATIYLDHLNDLENTIRMLCRAYHFASAIRLLALHKRPELLKSLIDSGLIEASATMTEMLAEMKSQLQAQLPRLRDLRVKKAEDPMAFLDGGGDGGDKDIPDNISLAPTDASTSGGTFMTRYTNNSMGTLATNATRKTSKNRRREERKRARGKKGTVYEEEYLVNSIRRLMERWNESVEDVERLVEGLMRRGMRERAGAVEGVMKDVGEVCRGCMEEVFGTAGSGVVTRQDGEGMLAKPAGGEGVLFEALTAAGGKQEAPLLKAFAGLSLLTK
ncbi:unnamed protein product [Zymoseptoria tritici ST99CH_1E4]|uniref:Elongator complex protein 1 n=1 Tax=Zymoseptoria tritici ST99CH_1E4 TaxID=1276532 RepID=A0A2H1H5F4_ZYMTR|nr:unnamed protein product [Zymoseptoria tritici ST99CH_1E4]